MNSRGYTLVEILVVVSIIGLLFSIGFAGYRDFGRRQELQGVVKQIQGDLRKTQQMALSGVKPDDSRCNNPETLNGYYFRAISSGLAYTIEAYCTGGSVIFGETVNLPTGITISISSNPVLFKILGTGTNISLDNVITVTQTATGNSTTVTIGAGGEIK